MNMIFFGRFSVEKTDVSILPISAHDITVAIWVAASSVQEARRRVIFEIQKSGFEIIDLLQDLVEVSEDDFIEMDVSLEAFREATDLGKKLIFFGVADDGFTNAGPLPLDHRQDTKLSELLEVLESKKSMGRCLHFDSGLRCNEPIGAHSVQNSGMLGLIEESGHVVSPSFRIKTLRANSGLPAYESISTRKFSTFLGFCGVHDNELFRAIDTVFLGPSREQVALYAYRSLCREYFVKENSVRSFEEFSKKETSNPTLKSSFEMQYFGNLIGFRDLAAHKSAYDKMMSRRDFESINYTLFRSSKAPTVAFSGVLYPDFDFLGRPLQNIGDVNAHMSLVTYCSAPLEVGWGYLIAWLNDSNSVCIPFVESVKDAIKTGERLPDLLFRLLLCSENHAFSPSWWRRIDSTKKQSVVFRLHEYVDQFIDIDPLILARGLDSIVDWEFDSVEEKIG